jgi:GPH family glycoside/pentoside/hexuronide:cation symporter
VAGGPGSIFALIVGNLVYSFGKGIIIATFIPMAADTVDYGEWRTTVWAPGLLYGGMSIAVNVGMGIGGALSAWLLSLGTYLPNAVQAASSLHAIAWSYLWVPLIAVTVMAAWLLTYRLDAKIVGIKAELAQRRFHTRELEPDSGSRSESAL